MISPINIGASRFSVAIQAMPVDVKNNEDKIFEFGDVHVFIDENSFLYLKGTKVDFEVDGVNQGIKFHNPNVKAVCGCGESFEVEV